MHAKLNVKSKTIMLLVVIITFKPDSVKDRNQNGINIMPTVDTEGIITIRLCCGMGLRSI